MRLQNARVVADGQPCWQATSKTAKSLWYQGEYWSCSEVAGAGYRHFLPTQFLLLGFAWFISSISLIPSSHKPITMSHHMWPYFPYLCIVVGIVFVTSCLAWISPVHFGMILPSSLPHVICVRGPLHSATRPRIG